MNNKDVIKALKENSLRLTRSRLAVVDVLIENSENYLTVEEIYQRVLKKHVHCDQTSIYRALTKFDEIGIVKKGEFHKDAARYSINYKDQKKKHEHYFKCINCLTIEAFSDCFISKKEKELEANGYRELTHHLEISGLCPNCAK